jgi:hypothetical protein
MSKERPRNSRTTVASAIRATFQRRKTALPTRPPLAWTPAFYDDSAKKQQ